MSKCSVTFQTQIARLLSVLLMAIRAHIESVPSGCIVVDIRRHVVLQLTINHCDITMR